MAGMAESTLLLGSASRNSSFWRFQTLARVYGRGTGSAQEPPDTFPGTLLLAPRRAGHAPNGVQKLPDTRRTRFGHAPAALLDASEAEFIGTALTRSSAPMFDPIPYPMDGCGQSFSYFSKVKNHSNHILKNSAHMTGQSYQHSKVRI